jgi:ABC-type dipeptide/oligopeptide/nickel transport system ATPase component
MIFQEPHAALNPVFTIGTQLLDILRIHLRLSGKTAREKSLHLLSEMGFDDPRSVLGMYPAELSGGMAQRVMIAMALSCHPKLIIADEPTSALDIPTQSRILKLIYQLQSAHRFAVLMISHDLSLVSDVSEYVYLLEQGSIIDEGSFTIDNNLYNNLTINPQFNPSV